MPGPTKQSREGSLNRYDRLSSLSPFMKVMPSRDCFVRLRRTRNDGTFMEIACFYLPDFPLQVEWERLPVLRDREVIVVFSPAPAKQEVLDFTPGMRGVQVGMPLQEALSHSKGAVLVEADMPRYFEAFECVLKALEQCGPAIEAAELGCAYMDLTGLEKLYGGREGLKRALVESIPPPFIARVGIARGKFPARAILEVRGKKWEVGSVAARCACPTILRPVAARCTCPSRTVEQSSSSARPPGSTLHVPDPPRSGTLHVPRSNSPTSHLSPLASIQEVGEDVEEFLRGCEVDILPVSWKTRTRLHDFGLHTLGQIAALPLGPFQAQFGPEGKKIWELSRGIDNRPLIPRDSQETVSVYLSFPEATASQGVILLAVESLLRRAFARPELRGRYARGVVLQGLVAGGAAWERRITFREPVADKKRILFIIKSALDGVALPGPMEDLKLTVLGLTGETGRQESFFAEVRRKEQLGDALRQLETRLGKAPPLYEVRPLEPWSRIPERRQALVRFSP
ncbi:MAG: hypothetical protein HYY29_01680 [Chloroflexi bacterium]|nr:hypothetical protein [Chloroflexota bacterium]